MQRLLAPWRTLFRHRDFVVLLGCNVLLGLAYSFVGPFMSMFGTLEVGMTPMEFGIFMTITAVSAIGLTTWLARWSDTHFSRRAMLVLGCVCGILGYLGYAFVRDVVWLTVIGSLVLGISSITFSQLFAHARELVARSDIAPRDAPLYMNVFRLFFALAWTVGPAVAAWVMVKYSYRGMFLVAAVVFLVLLLTVLLFVPATPPPGPRTAGGGSLREALRRSDLLANFAGFVLVFIAGTMGMMNLPLLVLKVLGGHEQQVGIVYSVAPFFELPFMYYFGFLATKGDHARIIRIGFAIAVAYYAALTLVQAPWHVYLVQILSAATTAVVSGVAITFFQNFLPDQAGTATNLYATAQRIGSTAGYLLFGVLVATVGHRSVFLVCAALCTVALALLFAFRDPAPAPAAVAVAGPA
jgi:SET family sugar efflux transporter-like MFS transporter